ncbi:MAG: zinc ribbon domain-containing protein [Myxococcota bacterium]
MPIYEYECTSCGHRFEQLVRIGADAPPCPECAHEVRKLVSPSAFILKGGGWYKDHYGLKSDSSSKKSESSGASASSSSKDGGSGSGSSSSGSSSSGSSGGSAPSSSGSGGSSAAAAK